MQDMAVRLSGYLSKLSLPSLGVTDILEIALISFSAPAMADYHHKMRVRGTVENVDASQKTFSVKERDGKVITFRVDDRSEFEVEDRDRDDRDVPFSELKAGDHVKVKAYRGEQPHLVDDVDIYR